MSQILDPVARIANYNLINKSDLTINFKCKIKIIIYFQSVVFQNLIPLFFTF